MMFQSLLCIHGCQPWGFIMMNGWFFFWAQNHYGEISILVGEIVSNNIIPLYPFTISFTPHNHHYFSPSKQINNAPKSSFPGHIYNIYIITIIIIIAIIISIYESSFVFFFNPLWKPCHFYDQHVSPKVSVGGHRGGLWLLHGRTAGAVSFWEIPKERAAQRLV